MKIKKEIEQKLTLTKKNVKELNEKLKDLIHNKRKEIIKELKDARKQGDLSENSEYDAAKQKQGEIEEKIAEIKRMLKNSQIVNPSKSNCVVIGKKVKLLDMKTGTNMEFKIGSYLDIDVKKNTISNISPLARALMGHKVGDEIWVKDKEIRNPYRIKILEIK